MFSFASGFLFGKPAEHQEGGDDDPVKAQLREWKKNLNKEMRDIDRQCRDIDRTIDKHKKEIQTMIKKGGQEANVNTLAKGIAKGRKTKERMQLTRAQLNSIGMQLQEQASQLRVMKVLTRNTAIMKDMGRLISAPDISADMRKMAEEMQKAGIIGEMMDEAMDEALPVDEEEVDQEVADIIAEVTAGVASTALPMGGVRQKAAVAAPAAAAPGRVAVMEGGASYPAGGGAGAGAGAGGGSLQDRLDNL